MGSFYKLCFCRLFRECPRLKPQRKGLDMEINLLLKLGVYRVNT